MACQVLPLAVFFILSVWRVESATTLRAEVSVGGVKGSITFTQTVPAASVRVTFALSGKSLPTGITWELRNFRVNFDVRQPCSDTSLGPRVLPSVTGTAINSTVSGFDLSGAKSIEGLSVVLLNSSRLPFACATIENTGTYVTARAVFRSRVLGVVVFRQVAGPLPPGAVTRVISDLYFDNSGMGNQNLDWRIVDSSGDCNTVSRSVVTATNCTSSHTSCAVGDLSGKLGRVSVGTAPSSTRLSLLDLNLPLSGINGVTAGTKRLVLHSLGQSTPTACADIRLFQARTGRAEFSDDGVKGSVVLTQDSPFDPVMVMVNLTNLATAGGYHIHEWPVPQRVTASQQVCSAAAVAGHFNPFARDYKTFAPPSPAAGTEDEYEVGDLSGKFGMLSGLNEKKATYRDWNLQLFGPRSVLGRSLVIHKDLPDAPRWVCTNIRPTVSLTSALATFTFPVIGHVLFQQPVGEADEDTSVFVEMDYADGSSNITDAHSWAIHATSHSDDQLQGNPSQRCASTGDVVNPFGAWKSSYAEQCTTGNPLRCMLGDMGRKHGRLSVRAAGGERSRALFTDVNLPLSGDNSIVGKSVVLMASSSDVVRLACANILPVMPRVVSGLNAQVLMTQKVGVIREPTFLYLNMTSLPAGDSRLQILSKNSSCQSASGVFNPFAVAAPLTPSATLDRYPVGDISGKFGVVSTSSRSRELIDSSLNLFGPRSVVGRSIILMSGTNFLNCSELMDTTRLGGMQVKAKAVFTGDVTGQISLSQYLYPDGTMSDTTVKVELSMTNGPQTNDHNWHTHENLVFGDGTAATNRCMSTGGHYNPFKVNVTANYQECSESNPLRCELGDQSGKLGTYSMSTGIKLGSDSFLPLAGQYGVIGRSIVVHAPNKGAARLACADILPDETSNYLDVFITTPPQINRKTISDTYADALSTGRYNIVVDVKQMTPNACTMIRVFFLGLKGAENRRLFQQMSGNKGMNPYNPTLLCSGVNSTDHGTSSASRAPLDLMLLSPLIASVMASHLMGFI